MVADDFLEAVAEALLVVPRSSFSYCAEWSDQVDARCCLLDRGRPLSPELAHMEGITQSASLP